MYYEREREREGEGGNTIMLDKQSKTCEKAISAILELLNGTSINFVSA